MNMQVWQIAAGVFTGTLPLLGIIVLEFPFLELKTFRSEVRAELSAIRAELANIRERLATLEERDRWIHPPVVEGRR